MSNPGNYGTVKSINITKNGVIIQTKHTIFDIKCENPYSMFICDMIGEKITNWKKKDESIKFIFDGGNCKINFYSFKDITITKSSYGKVIEVAKNDKFISIKTDMDKDIQFREEMDDDGCIFYHCPKVKNSHINKIIGKTITKIDNIGSKSIIHFDNGSTYVINSSRNESYIYYNIECRIVEM